MSTTFRLDGRDWPERVAMMARLDSLVMAGNIRILYAEQLDARCSTYQYSVMCTSLGIDDTLLHGDEQRVVATAYGSWEHELSVVMEAVVDVLEEWELGEKDNEDARA